MKLKKTSKETQRGARKLLSPACAYTDTGEHINLFLFDKCVELNDMGLEKKIVRNPEILKLRQIVVKSCLLSTNLN